LLLDNDERMLSVLQSILKALGFELVFTARDGFEGVEMLKRRRFDLIITDWDLQPIRGEAARRVQGVIETGYGSFSPNNGASFVRSLRHAPASPNPFVPVIMVMGPTIEQNVLYARDSGVNEILRKPIDAETLCARIVDIIDNPRPFITSKSYRGPCRRHEQTVLPAGTEDRRRTDIRIIRQDELGRHGR
jgi:two-component system chemotaxis response regulator CheY